MKNQMELTFTAMAQNEAFARMVVSAFMMQANPTLSIVAEVRTAVSEAVTNAIVHAYGERADGRVILRAALEEDRLIVEVEDAGCGIADIAQAMTPFYTSQPEKERSGMGFSLMQSFMDGVEVFSEPGSGTRVRMIKLLCGGDCDVL